MLQSALFLIENSGQSKKHKDQYNTGETVLTTDE